VFRSDLAKEAELLVLRHENVCVPRTSSVGVTSRVALPAARP
jgi:hypothetical protein